ncbi:MAG: hypothetical protein AAF806_22490 [Bacteroidota bacterium]
MKILSPEAAESLFSKVKRLSAREFRGRRAGKIIDFSYSSPSNSLGASKKPT